MTAFTYQVCVINCEVFLMSASLLFFEVRVKRFNMESLNVV